MPKRNPIDAAEVANVFDEDCINSLLSGLPRVDHRQFGEGLRSAARTYANDVHALSNDEVRAEISELLEIANFNRPSTFRTTGVKYEKVARKLERLSDRARKILTDRAAGMSQVPKLPAPSAEAIGRNGEILTRKAFAFSVALPPPGDLRDPMLREKACETVRMLCSYGAQIKDQKLIYDLYAPGIRYDTRSPAENSPISKKPIRRRRPKRKPELEFVGALRMLWLMNFGKRASRTGNTSDPGPFVRFAAVCLDLVGAYFEENALAGAVKLINEWERRRSVVEAEISARGGGNSI